MRPDKEDNTNKKRVVMQPYLHTETESTFDITKAKIGTKFSTTGFVESYHTFTMNATNLPLYSGKTA